MKFFYHILGGVAIFLLRQFFLPIAGSLADLILICPAVFIWLWFNDKYSWCLLLVPAALVDIILVRSLPFYLLTSLASMILYFSLITPNFSHNTAGERFLVYLLAVIIWRLVYIVWLAVGWLFTGEVLIITSALIWFSLSWIFFSLLLAVIIIGSRQVLIFTRHQLTY